MRDRVLRGTVVTDGRLLPDSVVAVAGDRIVAVLPAAAYDGPLPPASSSLLLPGLVDVHDHGGAGHGFPDATIARRDQPLVHQASPKHDGQRHQAHRRQFPRNPEHHASGKNEQHRELEQFVEADVEKTLDLVDVVVEHRHRLAHAVILEKLDLPRLQVVVGVRAKLVLHTLGKRHEPILKGPLEEAFKTEDHHAQYGEEHCQRPRINGAEQVGDPARRLAPHRVDHPAHQHGRHQVQHLVEDARNA